MRAISWGVGVVFFILGTAAVGAEHSGLQWSKRMKELHGVLSELLPDITDDSRFNSPKNFGRIEKNAKKLADLTHGMKAQVSSSKGDSPDPSIASIAHLFDAETERAYQELKRGNRNYARSLLRSVPSFCIGCHTRTTGPGIAAGKMPTFASRLDQGEYLAATRNFDQAFSLLEEVVADPRAAEGRQLEWERAARTALAIAVRVKQDPARALSIVDRVIAAPNAPQFLKEDSRIWRKAIQEWAEEPHREMPTEEGLYSEAVRLLGKAREAQKYPADRAGDIQYLRLTATSHELLRRFPEGKRTAEALMLLGVSYEALRDLDLWSLHELYFTACIEKAPHSPVAEGCYRQLEQSIYAGYSGSGGLSLPGDVQRRLEELRKLSAPSEIKSP